jgi:hypothetical protein
MKLAFAFLAVTAIIAPAAMASPTTCPMGGLDLYLVPNFTCMSGNLLFSAFTYSGAANPSNIVVPATAITVTPQTMTGNEGFQFQAGWSVGTTQPGNINSYEDSLINFTISTINHANTLNELTLFFDGSHTGSGLTGVTEQYCAGGTLQNCPQATAQIKVTNPPQAFNDMVFFAAVNTVSVSKDINVTSGTNGTAAISQVINTFQQSGVPEPMSCLLLGSGLLGLGLLRKRSQRS